jgi:hypothetical protein
MSALHHPAKARPNLVGLALTAHRPMRTLAPRYLMVVLCAIKLLFDRGDPRL